MKSKYLTRSTLLRSAGVSMALPMLESMLPAVESERPAADGQLAVPQRFAAILLPFGIYSPTFHPTQAGRDYDMPEVLKVLEPHRNDITVFSGLDHGVTGGHQACHAALSGITHAQAAAYTSGNIGLDQFLADHVGSQTRLPSLCLGGNGRIGAGWTRAGVTVPAEKTPLDAFNRLFLDEGPEARKQQAEFLASGSSILDAVNDSARSFRGRLSSTDRSKLDEYFTAVRETERGVASSIKWLERPRPRPSMPASQS